MSYQNRQQTIEVVDKQVIAVTGGSVGPPGPEGPPGASIVIKGSDTYANISAINDAEVNDLWIVTDSGAWGDAGDGFAWTGSTWDNVGAIQGPEGPAGPTGAQGPQGIQGDPGVDGAQGPQGDTGPAGADGAQGPQGIQGIQGIQGETGDTGPQGLQGIQGETGATGPKGDPGDDGTDGAQGPQGIQGETGPEGPQGPQGIQGPAGQDGQDGSSIVIKGSDTYANIIALPSPAVNDLWIQTDSGGGGSPGDGLVYNGSGWDNVGPIQGPEGPQGPQGDPGADGAQGPQGDQGIQGIQGPAGNDGAAGADGAGFTGGSYSPGTGVVTFTSDDGLGFSTGDLRGADGADGATGATGAQGPQGEKGDPGDTGPQGPQGIQGIQGDPGADGDDGADGADGAITVDAPNDGEEYVRKNLAWAIASAGGGGLPDQGVVADTTDWETLTTAGVYQINDLPVDPVLQNAEPATMEEGMLLVFASAEHITQIFVSGWNGTAKMYSRVYYIGATYWSPWGSYISAPMTVATANYGLIHYRGLSEPQWGFLPTAEYGKGSYFNTSTITLSTTVKYVVVQTFLAGPITLSTGPNVGTNAGGEWIVEISDSGNDATGWAVTPGTLVESPSSPPEDGKLYRVVYNETDDTWWIHALVPEVEVPVGFADANGDLGLARPDYPVVIWSADGQPTNIASPDIVIRTDEPVA